MPPSGPQRPSTSASKASLKRTCEPGLGDLLARMWACTSWVPAITRSTSASTAPPLALAPNSRALMTLVLLNTSRSPASSRSGSSRNTRSTGASARPSSSREALRSAAGCWAISSGGSSKSKSLTAKEREDIGGGGPDGPVPGGGGKRRIFPCRPGGSRPAPRGGSGSAGSGHRAEDVLQRRREAGHAALGRVQLVQAEQADAEGLEVRTLIALQRHAGGALHAFGQEGLAGVQAVVRGVADHHAGRLEALGRHAAQALRFEQRAHLPAQRELLLAQALEAVGARLQHRLAAPGQRVGRHRRVVGVAAGLVGLHDLQPLLHVPPQPSS